MAYEMRISDWSSDVCSSDLGVPPGPRSVRRVRRRIRRRRARRSGAAVVALAGGPRLRGHEPGTAADPRAVEAPVTGIGHETPPPRPTRRPSQEERRVGIEGGSKGRTARLTYTKKKKK